MIETIRKKICIDRSRSHTTGILPYIPYNGVNASVNFVTTGDESGNWGGFPMDLALARTKEQEDSMGFRYREFRFMDGEEGSEFSTPINRMKYADIIRRYNEIQKMLDEATYTKAVIGYKDADGKVVYEQGEDCTHELIGPGETSGIVLTTRFEKIRAAKGELLDETEDIIGRYDFIPIPDRGFSIDKNGYYWDGPADLVKGNYYVLLSDYETYRKYEDLWVEWWQEQGMSYRNYFDIPEGEFCFCRVVEKYIIGKVAVPESIRGIRVPQYVYYTDIEKYKAWFEKNGLTEEGAIDNKPEPLKKRFFEKGGIEFYRFLCGVSRMDGWIRSIPSSDSYSLTYVTPYIAVPISLEENQEYDSIYENYLYSYSEEDDNFVEAFSDFDGGNISRWIEPENLYTDSMLNEVMDENATEVNGIAGTWIEFDLGDDESNIFKCTFHTGRSLQAGEIRVVEEIYEDGEHIVEQTNEPELAAVTMSQSDRIVIASKERETIVPTVEITEIEDEIHGEGQRTVKMETINYVYKWWECKRQSKAAAARIKCGDGEELRSGQMKYRSVSVLDCVKQVEPSPEDGAVYYFMVRKDNGLYGGARGQSLEDESREIATFKIPFTEGSFHGMRESDIENIFVGNYIIDIDEGDEFWTIHYVIGGDAKSEDGGKTFEPIPNTGIHYEEKFGYKKADRIRSFMDGFEDIEIFCDWIDTDDAKEVIYNDEYGLYRRANRAKVTGMEVGSDFQGGKMMNAMVFTRGGSESLPDTVKESVDILMDRGSAAAFERHFKLSECNSLEDLKNYGNNFYNL